MTFFATHFTGLTLVEGRSYVDGHGDTKGPMRVCDGAWLDQHGALFHKNGIQWDHVPDSAGNLKREVTAK